jgi:hypothetical protein
MMDEKEHEMEGVKPAKELAQEVVQIAVQGPGAKLQPRRRPHNNQRMCF